MESRAGSSKSRLPPGQARMESREAGCSRRGSSKSRLPPGQARMESREAGCNRRGSSKSRLPPGQARMESRGVAPSRGFHRDKPGWRAGTPEQARMESWNASSKCGSVRWQYFYSQLGPSCRRGSKFTRGYVSSAVRPLLVARTPPASPSIVVQDRAEAAVLGEQGIAT
jgi:hypothetical protein